jgi:hypothetical protein
MTPLLTGVLASQISGHLTPAWSPEGGYDSLATVTLASAASAISFTGIPSNYKHLQIRSLSQSSTTTGNWMRHIVAFNSDTTNSNYIDHILAANGTVATGVSEASTRKGFGHAGCSHWGVNITDILDYSSDTKRKVSRTLRGVDSLGSQSSVIATESNLWLSSSPINSITMNIEDGSNFISGSTFALYGVK